MKRTPLLRKTPLHPGSKPMRRSPIKRRNARRYARLKAEQFGTQAELCRHLPCCATFPWLYGDDLAALDFIREERVSDPHHCKTTGAGGVDRWTVPLSRAIHQRLDSPGNSQASVEAEYGVDFRAIAERLHRHVRAGS